MPENSSYPRLARQEVLAGAMEHINTLMHTGCRRAGAMAAVCLSCLAEDEGLDDSLGAACLALAETLEGLGPQRHV